MGATYLDLLERFDRKERGWLIRECTGGRGALSETFCSALAAAFGLPVVAPAAWWTIDYHLDWLAGVSNWSGAASEETFSGCGVTCSIEDVDLIVGLPGHLLLIEAKAAGSWDSAQLASKVARLESICPGGTLPIRSTGEQVQVHFGLLSIRPPARLGTSHWPGWTRNGSAPFIVKPESPGPWSKLAVQRAGSGGDPEVRWRIVETAT